MKTSPSLSSFGDALFTFAHFHHNRQCLVSRPGENLGEDVCEVIFGFHVAGLDIPFPLFVVCVEVFCMDMFGLIRKGTSFRLPFLRSCLKYISLYPWHIFRPIHERCPFEINVMFPFANWAQLANLRANMK